jgi:trehalose/maltose transport system permease protein
MAVKLEKRPTSLKVLIYAFIVIWLIVAAFPFIWTVWGSFKVELDFFSISDWTNALTGERTKA